MSSSILTDTKKAVGIGETDTSFDLDLVMHINSVFATLTQLGVGPAEGFAIEDAAATWDSFLLGEPRFNFVKTYVYLKVRMVFDPPGTSYLMTAFENQIRELEFRINLQRETMLTPVIIVDTV